MSETPGNGLPNPNGIQPPERLHPENRFALATAQREHRPKPHNEDFGLAQEITLGDGTKVNLVAVADGVSDSGKGYVKTTGADGQPVSQQRHAHEASQQAIHILQELLTEVPTRDVRTQEGVIQLLKDLNEQVTNHFIGRDRALANQHGHPETPYFVDFRPASTISFALLFPDGYLPDNQGRPQNALFAGVGDSSLYVVSPAGKLRLRLTPPDGLGNLLRDAIDMHPQDEFNTAMDETAKDRVVFGYVEPGSTILAASDGAKFHTLEEAFRQAQPDEKPPMQTQCDKAIAIQRQHDQGELKDDVTIAAMRA